MKNAMREYRTLEAAYQFFNERLFHDDLPASCMLTLNRRGNYDGYFSPERFIARVSSARERINEIALNSDRFAGRKDEDILSVLVHQMVHAWAHYYGKKSARPTYHSQAWADKMEQIGLMPTATGEPGGERTGQKMSHSVITGGYFEAVCEEFLDRVVLGWNSIPDEKKKNQNKLKYTCLECGQNAWAATRADLVCGRCQTGMMPAE